MKKNYLYKTKNSKRFNFFRENSPERGRGFFRLSGQSPVGFTLIEVLVTVAVTGILTVLASVIFINTVRNSKKAEITAEARQNAALVIDRVQKDARGASSLETLLAGKRLKILNGSDEIYWECHAPSGTSNGFIGRKVNTASELTVTNKDTVDGVSVSTCSFNPPGPADLITIEFTLTEGVDVQSGPQEYRVQLPFKTSVSKRGS